MILDMAGYLGVFRQHHAVFESTMWKISIFVIGLFLGSCAAQPDPTYAWDFRGCEIDLSFMNKIYTSNNCKTVCNTSTFGLNNCKTCNTDNVYANSVGSSSTSDHVCSSSGINLDGIKDHVDISPYSFGGSVSFEMQVRFTDASSLPNPSPPNSMLKMK